MSVGHVCTRTVYTTVRTETVREAAERMKDHRVGTLVVVDLDRRPVGVLTDRDIVLRCVAEDRLPAATRVGEIFSSPATVVAEGAPLENAIRTMVEWGVRRLVVVGPDGALVGVLSLDDVLQILFEQEGDLGRLLEVQAPV